MIPHENEREAGGTDNERSENGRRFGILWFMVGKEDGRCKDYGVDEFVYFFLSCQLIQISICLYRQGTLDLIRFINVVSELAAFWGESCHVPSLKHHPAP